MNSQKILINTSEWYANSTDKTLGAMVQYIASVLDSKIGGCEYVVINNYPAIKKRFFLALSFLHNDTSLLKFLIHAVCKFVAHI